MEDKQHMKYRHIYKFVNETKTPIATLGWYLSRENTIVFALARCAPCDDFAKEMGRRIVTGRLEKGPTKESKGAIDGRNLNMQQVLSHLLHGEAVALDYIMKQSLIKNVINLLTADNATEDIVDLYYNHHFINENLFFIERGKQLAQKILAE